MATTRSITRSIARSITRGLTGAEPQLSGAITEPIYTNDNINVLFTETVNPATVTTNGDGTGSFEVYDNTGAAWVAGSTSTADNLTFSFNPTSDLTAGSSYTIHLSTAIRGSATGTSYSGENFTFTAVATVIMSNTTFLDDDCSALPNGWTIVNGKVGPDTTQVTFDGEDTFRQLTTATGANYTQIKQDVGTFVNVTTLTLDVYHDILGSVGTNGFYVYVDGPSNKHLRLDIGTNNIGYWRSGPSQTYFGVGASQDVWIKYTLVMDWANNLFDFYMDDTAIATSQTMDYTLAGTPGTVYFTTNGVTINEIITYINYIKVGDGLV